MPIQVQVTQTGLEASIQKAAQKAGRNLKINLGTSSKDINALSQPLGRITGQADEFTKSMEAANARVLAFGASVGILNGVVRAFKDLVSTTIEVEKSLASINAILQQNSQQINRFKNEIFEVAKNTEQTFGTVAEAALELSRQGLKAEEVTKRLNDALILSRLSGLDAANAVSGLTSAINAFNSTGITSGEVLNKLSAAAASAAVSERDLIEAIKRSGSVAVTTGVEFDELVGIVSALQQKTSRGGSVIGNSLKTIFTRIQSLENLQTLQDLGVQVTDLSGNVVSSSKLIENLSGTFKQLDQQSQINLADKLVGKFQIAPFLALVEDYNSQVVTSARVTEVSFNATNEAYQRNITLNKTLSAVINEASVNFKQLSNTLGEIGVTDSLKNIISFFSGLAENIKNIVEGDGIGSDIAKGFIKGFSAVLSGPGLAIVAGIIGKLAVDLVKFGTGSLKTFFGLNRVAKEQAAIQGQIASTLLSSQSIQKQILAIENSALSVEQKRAAQAKFFTTAINEQLTKMKQMQTIAATISPAVVRGTASARKASGGFLPIGSEKSDISRGVGGAPSSAKPVVIPNFAFGGGKRGTMVANDSEYIIPNYANGGDAIFNQNMAASMGLPANAKKISAASGYIPNYATTTTARRREIFNSGKLENYRVGNTQTFKDRDGSTFSKAQLDAALKSKRATSGQIPTINTNDKYAAIVNTARDLGHIFYANKGKKGFNIANSPTGADSTRIVFSSYGLDPKIGGKRSKKLEEQLTNLFTNQTRNLAKSLTGGTMPKPEKLNVIKKTLNKGVAPAAAGTIFESAIQSIVSDNEFDNRAIDTSLFDFTGSAIQSIVSGQGKLFNMPAGKKTPKYLEAKTSDNESLMQSVAEKIFKAENKIKPAFTSVRDTVARKRGAASGYIPNFAGGGNYVFDSDKIDRKMANQILKSILATKKRKDLLIAPAGAGKSTAAARLGKFIMSPADVQAAKSFTILSGAARAKKGVMSAGLQNIIQSVNDSGGKVSYLYAPNSEIRKRRYGRLDGGPVDTRSMKQLRGTLRAPMNQFDFIKGVKGSSSNFGILRGSNGYVPNFAGGALEDAIQREQAAGLPVNQIRINQSGKLRNAQNPMGLAVTNTRDEPTGAIPAAKGYVPNFVSGAGIQQTSFKSLAQSKSTQEVTKANKDYLGTIFALQIATSALSGATSDATSKAGRVANEFTKLLSSITTVAFAFSAVNQMTQGMQGGFGKVAKGLGVAGAALTTAFVVFKAGRNIFREMNGSAQAAREATASFADAVDEAGVSLSGLSKLAQVQRKQEAKDLIYNIKGKRFGMDGSKEFQEMMAEFQLLSGIEGSGQEAQNKISEILRRSGALNIKYSFDPETSMEYEEISLNEDKAKQALSDFLRSPEAKENQEKLRQERAAKQKEEQEIKEIAQLQTRFAKERLKTEIEILKITKLTNSDLDFQIKKAETLKSISEGEIDLLKNKAAFQELGNSFAEKNLGFIDKTVEGIQSIVTDENKLQELRGKLSGLSKEDLTNRDTVLSVIRQTLKLEIENDELLQGKINNLSEQLTREKEIYNAKKQQLQTDQAREAVLKSQNFLRQKEIEASKKLFSDDKQRLDSQTNLRNALFENFKTQQEGRKIGGGQLSSLAIDRETSQREATVIAKNLADSVAKSLANLRGTLLDRAISAGVTGSDLKDIESSLTKAETQKQFEGVAEKIEEAQINSEIKRLEGVQKELDGRINILKVEASIVDKFGLVVNTFAGLFGKSDPNLGENAPAKKGIEELEKISGGITKQIADLIFNTPTGSLDSGIKSAFNQITVAGVKATNDIIKLSQALSEAGANLGTFANLIKGEFTDLSLGIAQNQFNLATATTPDQISQALATEQRQNILRSGPQNLETIQNANAAQLAFEKRLEIARATSTEQRLNIEFEYEKTLQLLDLRNKIQKATGEEREKLIEDFIELQGAEKTLGQQLQAALSIDAQEGAKNLKNTIVDGSVKFRDNVIDGITQAVEQGGSLKDILRSAALDFARDMTRTNLQNISGGFMSLFSGQGMANGGRITGGSGTKDDVPAMLMGGEYVIKKDSVQKYGLSFMDNLNNGSIPKFAQGGYFAPGFYGQGAITGKKNLLDFATQSYTTGSKDVLFSDGNAAAISLEPESVRLSSIGRTMGTPMQRATEEAKGQAFDLYLQQMQREKELRQAEKERKKQLRNQLIMAAVSTVASGIGSNIGAGISGSMNSLSQTVANPTFGQKIGAAFSGGFQGLKNFGSSAYQGVTSLFSGNFKSGFSSLGRAYDPYMFAPKAIRVGPSGYTRATGGSIPSTSGIDTVPAMLSGGEFVMNNAAAKNIGTGNLNALNSGASSMLTEEKSEELNEKIINKLDELIESGVNSNGEINITVNNEGKTTEQSGGDEQSQGFAKRIRDAVIRVIEEEKRLGGTLRRGLA